MLLFQTTGAAHNNASDTKRLLGLLERNDSQHILARGSIAYKVGLSYMPYSKALAPMDRIQKVDRSIGAALSVLLDGATRP